MDVLRLYDPDRRPPNWSDLIDATALVAFASDADTGTPTDARGAPFEAAAAATCLVFDSLADARQYCEARVAEQPALRFDIFDARGRVEEPLLVIVHPGRSPTPEGSSRAVFWRRCAAIALIGAAGPLVWYDYWSSDGTMVLPTFLGISMAVAGLRLLFMNLILRESERARRERLDRHQRPPGG
jgi:hypothetical protein